jgi:hypothetical protein
LLQVNKGKFTAFLGFLVPKKYPAFLTADDYQIFSASEVFSQKIRTAARSPLAFSSAMEGDHAPYNCKNCFQKSTDRRISWGPAAQTRLRRRRGTLSQLRRCLEDYRRPFDTLRTGIDDPPVIVKILSHLGLPTRGPPRAPAR